MQDLVLRSGAEHVIRLLTYLSAQDVRDLLERYKNITPHHDELIFGDINQKHRRVRWRHKMPEAIEFVSSEGLLPMHDMAIRCVAKTHEIGNSEIDQQCVLCAGRLAVSTPKLRRELLCLCANPTETLTVWQRYKDGIMEDQECVPDIPMIQCPTAETGPYVVRQKVLVIPLYHPKTTE